MAAIIVKISAFHIFLLDKISVFLPCNFDMFFRENLGRKFCSWDSIGTLYHEERGNIQNAVLGWTIENNGESSQKNDPESSVDM